MNHAFNGFSYAIDYDRAISEDEATIAWCDRMIAGSFFLPKSADAAGQSWDAFDLAFVDASARERLGMSADDLRDVLWFARELDATGADYRNGKAVLDRIVATFGGPDRLYLLTEWQVRGMRRAAVAARSRHIRNRAKNRRR